MDCWVPVPDAPAPAPAPTPTPVEPELCVEDPEDEGMAAAVVARPDEVLLADGVVPPVREPPVPLLPPLPPAPPLASRAISALSRCWSRVSRDTASAHELPPGDEVLDVGLGRPVGPDVRRYAACRLRMPAVEVGSGVASGLGVVVVPGVVVVELGVVVVELGVVVVELGVVVVEL
ncbi:MAG: hypothetical protein ABI890_17535, partial [Lapillicoccus sp.]